VCLDLLDIPAIILLAIISYELAKKVIVVKLIKRGVE
jgi:hypothetical protein